VAEAFHTDYRTVQFAISLFLLANALGLLFLGGLSDLIGRRPALLLGIAVLVIGAIVSAAAVSIAMLNVGRVLQGLGTAAGVVVGQAIIRDRYDRTRTASMVGYISLGLGAAPMLSPLVGGLVDDIFGWRMIFVLLAAIGCLVGTATYAFLPETRHHYARAERPTLAGVASLAAIPAFWAFALINACSNAVFFGFLGGSAFAARFIFDMSGTAYGLYFILVNLGYSSAAFLTARYARRTGLSFMILTGCVVALLATAGMSVALAANWLHPLTVFVPMLAINIANGLMQPNAIAAVASVRPDLAGTASGLGGALQIGAGSAVTVAVGAALDGSDSLLPFAYIVTGISIGTLICGLWSRAADSRHP
jgi:DHA1 family bicyclomycin/chloramphenicol resistance-like MFS transporter